MASLAYRRNGWELRYRDRAGRQRVERFPGRGARRAPEAARHRLAEVERDLSRGMLVAREEREATFGEYFERWSRSRQISATRQYTDDGRAKLHVLPYWQSWPICTIRPSDIDDWIGQLSRRMGPPAIGASTPGRRRAAASTGRNQRGRSSTDRAPTSWRRGRPAISPGITSDDVDTFDLCSCFPAAVQMAMRAVGINTANPGPRTVTGGLPYFGGPGASYALHAIAGTVEGSRDKGGIGAVKHRVRWLAGTRAGSAGSHALH